MKRRDLLRTTVLAGLAASLGAVQKRPPRILLRSSWQTINIGDIGHTPGVLAILEKHLPEVEVRLWPGDVGNGVKEMLLARFPKLVILQDQDAIKQALTECDFFLHGSGPYLVDPKAVARWSRETGKPYGVYGITFPPDRANAEVVDLLSKARFVYFRDSVSLAGAKEKGVTCPVMEFGPDGAFAVDLRNDANTEEFLRRHGLETGRFLCCIPRYRQTPEWLIPRKNRPVNQERQTLNEKMKEHDHAPLREAIVRVVRQTPMKVLLCPEDETQMALGKEMLLDKLPGDVKEKVVWREHFWLTDEALSTYVRSAGLFGNEMHSPIMCIGNGIPAVVCRWDTQTSKGFMWRDIGLDSWLFDFDDEADLQRLPEVVLAIARDPAAAKAKAAQARALIHQRQRATMVELQKHLPVGV